MTKLMIGQYSSGGGGGGGWGSNSFKGFKIKMDISCRSVVALKVMLAPSVS